MLRRAGLCVGLIALCGAFPAAATPCLVAGTEVVLRSNEYDPDVFVWDSRQRVIDYIEGPGKTTEAVLHHTRLSRPGTRALIIACAPNVARSRDPERLENAIGIKILSGPHRGHYGWVVSEDVHAIGS